VPEWIRKIISIIKNTNKMYNSNERKQQQHWTLTNHKSAFWSCGRQILSRNRTCSIRLQNLAPKNSAPDCMTDARETDASFLAPVSGIHRIHRHEHAFTDDTGMSKHRLAPYNAYYHNWQTLNCTASDSSSDDRCFLKVLIVLQLMQLALTGACVTGITGQVSC